MSDATPLADGPVFGVGDLLIAKMPDGTFQVSRVSANGRSSHVIGYQSTQPAATRMATGATSGPQRVFLKSEGESGEYSLVA